jgi:hypothetical protein
MHDSKSQLKTQTNHAQLVKRKATKAIATEQLKNREIVNDITKMHSPDTIKKEPPTQWKLNRSTTIDNDFKMNPLHLISQLESFFD